jgi:site-specific DNA-methyltransferase (adenine-specific)
MLDIRPIVVNKDMIVLGGNMRLKACKEAGLKEVPIIVADNLTEEQEREFLIKDNTSGGEWDWQMIANDWDAEQLDAWGLDVPSFEADEHLEAEEDDFDATPPEEPVTVLGDLYEIGEHRLLCGDSTDSDQVAKLMNGEKADMVFTDPPYGISYKSNWASKERERFNEIQNDDVILDILPSIILISKNNIHWYIWTSHQVYPIWREKFNEYYKSTIIWSKKSGAMGDLTGDYVVNYEMSLFCHYGRKALNGKRESAVWELTRDSGIEYEHPTQKPITLAEKAINNSSKENDCIADLFLGSGSTMVASHQLKRKCYGMELDPKYCDVIVKRMIKLDPTLTVKQNRVDVTKQWK